MEALEMTTTTQKNLFNFDEFGERNSMWKATVYKLVHKNQIRVTKLGKRSYISKDSEKEFLDSLTTGGPEVLGLGSAA